MRTEEEYYNSMRKVCCYCDRERAKEYKRAHSKTWTGKVRIPFKPVVKRVKKEPVVVERVKKPIPECVRFHVETLKRLKDGKEMRQVRLSKTQSP